MKEAIVKPDLSVEIQDSPIPEPDENSVVIHVIVTGMNPKDWKMPKHSKVPHNSGDDIAGIVSAVGSKVDEFHVGDRVAAFHVMRAPHGSFAEYAVAPSWTTFHIPKETTFEEAATIPLAAMTSALGVYQRLGLSLPWHPSSTPTPTLIYGGATAVGAFAIKLLRLSNIHPIITVAGRGIPFVETLIDSSKGDTVIDYRQGNDTVVSGIKAALKGQKLEFVFDAVSEKGSYKNIANVIDPHGKLTYVLNAPTEEDGIPSTVERKWTMVGDVHKVDVQSEAAKARGVIDDREFSFVMYRFMARGLREGYFKPHPHQVVAGGLDGIEKGLKDLWNGKASAVKYVFRIGETRGVEPVRL